jgi:hypothetical protein
MAGMRFRSSVSPHSGYARGRSLTDQARHGMQGVLGNLDKWINWVGRDVLPEVMLEAVKPAMDKSDHYAPKDTRTMVNSRYNEIRGRGDNVHVELGYNRNGEAPYTIFVHEMPQFYHEPPTQSKFLQRALDEETPEILGRIASGMKARTGL